jgi:hypothetical protein
MNSLYPMRAGRAPSYPAAVRQRAELFQRRDIFELQPLRLMHVEQAELD